MANTTFLGNPPVTVERNVWMTTSDGVDLASDMYRPDIDGALPVILIRIPYDKSQALNISYAHPSWYARQGYIVVCQDTRGRYESGGDWEPFRFEAQDGAAAIAWAASLPGSTGQVGTYGFSYGGATQLLAATERPDGLVTMCPAMTGSQYYDGWTYNNGALSLAFAASWAATLGPNTAQRRGDDDAMSSFAQAVGAMNDWHWVLPLDVYPPLDNADTSYFFDWLKHPTYDDYWQQWSIDEDYSRIDVSALHIAGWYDVFLDGTIRNFNGLRAAASDRDARNNQRLVIGPWYHIPWQPLGTSRPDEVSPTVVDDLQIAWFDLHLKHQTSHLFDAPVSVWVMGEDRWRRYDSWPPGNVVETNLYFRSGGRANSAFGDGTLSQQVPEQEPADVFTYDPLIPVLSAGGHSCCFPFLSPMGPADQHEREQWNTVLVYTSTELENDLLLIGDAEVVLYASSSARDTDWTVRLCVVDESGVSTNLQEGIVRARYRNSLREPEMLEPDAVYEYHITLGAVGYRVQSGSRLRIQVSSSDFPHWDRNLNTGGPLFSEGPAKSVVATQVVYHDASRPSHVRLPVVFEE